jgi:hypothetical protein
MPDPANEPLFNTLRFAYADPPYVGLASMYDHPDTARWDDPAEHHALMAEMDTTYDGWALSLASVNLRDLLPGAPAGTRVAAWVKPFCAYKRNVRVAYSWEPVLWKRTAPHRDGDPVGRDHLSAVMAMKRRLFGAKPETFGRWLIVLFGAQPCDEIVDLFPGAGAIGRALDIPRLV